jgi:hypothetical protein
MFQVYTKLHLSEYGMHFVYEYRCLTAERLDNAILKKPIFISRVSRSRARLRTLFKPIAMFCPLVEEVFVELYPPQQRLPRK